MGLCPGICHVNQSRESRVFIAEDPVWFLEHGVKKHCVRYTRYAHYGVTAVTRDEWLLILAEWERVRPELIVASLTTDLISLRLVGRETRRLFIRDFRAVLQFTWSLQGRARWPFLEEKAT
jgi:hypothetical protein